MQIELAHHHNIDSMFIHNKSLFWQLAFDNLSALIQRQRRSVGNAMLPVHASRPLAQREDRFHVPKLFADQGRLLQTPKQLQEDTKVGSHHHDVILRYLSTYLFHVSQTICFFLRSVGMLYSPLGHV